MQARPAVGGAERARTAPSSAPPFTLRAELNSNADLEPWRPDVARGSSSRRRLYPAGMFDEHLLDEPVRFANELLVVTLAYLPDLLELRIRQLAAREPECREHVLRLPCCHDVAHEAQEVAFTSGVCEVARDAHRFA